MSLAGPPSESASGSLWAWLGAAGGMAPSSSPPSEPGATTLRREDPVTMAAIRPTAIGIPGYSETLRCEPESVGRARRLVGTALGAWGLHELADQATLVTSELVTNALEHSKRRYMRLRVSRLAPDRVVVCVTDRSLAPPILRAPNEQDMNGRGLLLVDALSDSWGANRRPFGKSVWAELIAKAPS
ncbi:ATP-binding protein [Streptomyces chrestomyceticus]|uniref:ATP-binding protein n=1 Tax=Streptomyces chrestomyceticus TaxID=68185 RepID=UPI0033FB6419